MLIDDTTVDLTQAEFDALEDYSGGRPTDAAIGKRWRRWVGRFAGADQWQMGEYIALPEPHAVGIAWRDIVISLAVAA